MSPGDISSVSPVSARSDDGAPQKLPAMRGKEEEQDERDRRGLQEHGAGRAKRPQRAARPSPRRETRSSAAASSQTVGSTQAAVAMSCA